ncbi:hypothetical protein AWC38_SpisGene4820 [Stylophora pistillata]|uniref:Uncharacterized protein n=1 Tax=Stylophora pistillata TaxID=50429 RepID=A0A2B4SP78_STYPI|nr:hypothetical protein AWC38_SpisGene4820 [Stylophora pistillata]
MGEQYPQPMETNSRLKDHVGLYWTVNYIRYLIKVNKTIHLDPKGCLTLTRKDIFEEDDSKSEMDLVTVACKFSNGYWGQTGRRLQVERSRRPGYLITWYFYLHERSQRKISTVKRGVK